MSNNNYPLAWPEDWTRTKQPGKSQFKATLSAALKNVNKSIELFAKDSKHKIDDLIISSNVTLGSMNPNDSGVALYFNWNVYRRGPLQKSRRKPTSDSPLHRSRTHKIAPRWINLVEAAFRGYAGLPPPSAAGGSKPWDQVLGVTPSATLTHGEVRARYKRLLNTYHPDKPTGNPAPTRRSDQ